MIYWIGPTERHEHTGLVNREDHHVLMGFDGTPRAAAWRPIPARRYREGRSWRPADFPFYMSHVLVMRQTAVDVLRDMLEASGEILPLTTDDGVALHVLNVTRVLDALDEENSVLKRFESSGRISIIEAAAFHEHVVRDVDIFLLCSYGSDIFVSQRFVERVQSAGLTGLEFQLAWSPEQGALKPR